MIEYIGHPPRRFFIEPIMPEHEHALLPFGDS